MIEDNDTKKEVTRHLSLAFRRLLLEQIGSIEAKPVTELEAWILAFNLVEDMLKSQLYAIEKAKKDADSQLY